MGQVGFGGRTAPARSIAEMFRVKARHERTLQDDWALKSVKRSSSSASARSIQAANTAVNPGSGSQATLAGGGYALDAELEEALISDRLSRRSMLSDEPVATVSHELEAADTFRSRETEAYDAHKPHNEGWESHDSDNKAFAASNGGKTGSAIRHRPSDSRYFAAPKSFLKNSVLITGQPMATRNG